MYRKQQVLDFTIILYRGRPCLKGQRCHVAHTIGFACEADNTRHTSQTAGPAFKASFQNRSVADAQVLKSVYAPNLDHGHHGAIMKAQKSPHAVGKPFDVHPDVLKLGLVSFLTDLSSEMIFSVFAIFFTTVAGASAALLGMVEGLADLSACSLNYFAGWTSDRTGKRKVFALTGYGFSTLAKIVLLITSSVAGLSVFRVI